MFNLKQLFATAMLIALPMTATAKYDLIESQSKLVFVSIKKDSIGEVNEFKSLSGSIDKNGLATVEVDLTSVSTGIEIRDQRLQNHLFDTSKFSTAKVQTEVSLDALKELKVGESFHRHAPITLSLHGIEQQLIAHSDVYKLSENKILVISAKPVLVNANEFGLIAGVEKLKELAGLPSIATAIPVTFKLVFELD
ncbi:YceI family protein [Psychrosphaera ytuae]|uniref:YceI family protein n=1 Tax=Psychrosphaera ytuae TaxID=2820710 RepID=A0A975D9H6_9GAMM|nr:YceI family protein [Psychrosphaera ytuae]QTH62679.1 YceI family protein [Psychrosphaera ytuae]